MNTAPIAGEVYAMRALTRNSVNSFSYRDGE